MSTGSVGRRGQGGDFVTKTDFLHVVWQCLPVVLAKLGGMIAGMESGAEIGIVMKMGSGLTNKVA